MGLFGGGMSGCGLGGGGGGGGGVGGRGVGWAAGKVGRVGLVSGYRVMCVSTNGPQLLYPKLQHLPHSASSSTERFPHSAFHLISI